MATRDLNRLFASSDRSLERNIAVVERELRQVYRETLDKIQAQLARAYERYSVAGELTRAEMTKYNRLASLERDLNKIVGTSTQKARAATRRLQAQQFNESFFRHAWAIEQHVGVGISWGRVPQAAVRAAVENPLALIAEDRLRTLGRERIRRTIAQGLVRGDSFPRMAREIRAAINGQFSDAVRIVRTEGMRAATMGAQELYDHAEDRGIEGVEVWVATLDDRTRDSHADMDGREADDDGMFTLPSGLRTEGPQQSGDPAEDINCRCRVVYRIKELSPTLRRIRGEGVQPYQTFRQWEANR
jgi:hypothetical protein